VILLWYALKCKGCQTNYFSWRKYECKRINKSNFHLETDRNIFFLLGWSVETNIVLTGWVWLLIPHRFSPPEHILFAWKNKAVRNSERIYFRHKVQHLKFRVAQLNSFCSVQLKVQWLWSSAKLSNEKWHNEIHDEYEKKRCVILLLKLKGASLLNKHQ